MILDYGFGTMTATTLSNSKFLCSHDTSHQVSAQSDFLFGRFRLKNFKMAAILDIETERI